jgi:hypothetical protein
MIDRICAVCNEYVSDIWTLKLKDDKEFREFSGHLKCIDILQDQMNSISNVDKKSVQQVLKELKL